MLYYAIGGLIDRILPDSICWGRRKVESWDTDGSVIGWSRNKVSEVNNFFPGDIE